MIQPYDFYRTFISDYFHYKAKTYKGMIDNIEKVEPLFFNDSIGYSREDYLKSLKASLRQTYFHSIETLFELIFALEKGIIATGNYHEDEFILQRLSNSDFRKNFNRIETFGNGDLKATAFLDNELNLLVDNHKIKCSLLHYVFYYILNSETTTLTKNYWNLLDESLSAIKLSLQFFAKDFSDRTEYNSYKHGFRIIPMNREFKVMDLERNKTLYHQSYQDSMTYLKEGKGKLDIITRPFDTVRDYKMTLLVSDLIVSIINSRKIVYFKEPDTKVWFFERKNVDDFSKQNIQARELKVTINYG